MMENNKTNDATSKEVEHNGDRGEGIRTLTPSLTPIQSIRKFCLGCMNSCGMVRSCDNKQCPLHCFRMGMRESTWKKVQAMREVRKITNAKRKE